MLAEQFFKLFKFFVDVFILFFFGLKCDVKFSYLIIYDSLM